MGSLFAAKTPAPTPMPDAQSPLVKEAETRKQQQIMSRSGRTSTNLSGGDAVYGNSLLGQ